MKSRMMFSTVLVLSATCLAGCAEQSSETVDESAATSNDRGNAADTNSDAATENSNIKYGAEYEASGDDTAASDDRYARSAPDFGRESAESSTDFSAPGDSTAAHRPSRLRSVPTSDADASAPSTPSGPDVADARSARRKSGTGSSSSATSRRRPSKQSGILTAGSLNDQENVDEFREYVTKVLQSAPDGFAQVSLGQHVEIRVVDSEGNGVNEARVNVQTEDGTAVLDIITGTDGRTAFLSQLDGQGLTKTYRLTVQPADGSKPVTSTVSLDQTPWTIQLPQSSSRLPGHLDLALVIDTTGSMGDELEYLKAEIDSIAASVHRRFPSVKQRFSLILYRDEGDEYVTRFFDFSDSLIEFQDRLIDQSAGGGGDYPEAMHLALERAESLSWREADTARVLFLVGDAPPHSHHAERMLESAKRLRLEGVTIFPVAASGAREQCEFLMRMAAFLTQGQYLFLTDHSGVGNPHAKPTASRYNVERLDQLMFRMIASELAGEPFHARDIIATEEGDFEIRPNRQVPVEQNQEGAAIPQPNDPIAAASIETSSEKSFLDEPLVRWGAVATIVVVLIAVERRFRT